MPLPTAYFWSKAPFVRLLIALVAGIVLQWQLQFSIEFLRTTLAITLAIVITYFFIPVKWKYQFGYINGIVINLVMALSGGTLVWANDVRNNNNWIGNHYSDSSYVFVTIEEPLVEKTKSFKALATINGVYQDNKFIEAEGKLILYFKKDSSLHQLHYGSQIIFNKPLQEIRNSGNPGTFNYKQYSLFQGITHQVNLAPEEFKILPTENKSWFQQFIFNCRHWVVTTLQKFIPAEKEQGLAEALLIGYKDDLDKNLVQSYTNTGVVHIIAISGMHLALVYALLLLLTKPLRRKQLAWLQAVLILSALWLFTLLAGAQASVVRSAVMFTCIVFAKAIDRKTSIYNTLASSAFLLLCFNPFWLWDVGFQLSYAAVVSIVTFYRAVYNWFYIPNKVLDFFWKTMAISIAAQILTTPISLYHFHQFPVLFLLTNLFAVPVSSLVLFGEIAICAFSWLYPLARCIGVITQFLIWCMNSYIERIETISFSLWNGFSINIPQTILMLIGATAVCFWLMDKKKWMLWLSLSSLLLFIVLRSWSFTEAYHQKKLIVYNVPKYSAIDLINGRMFNFLGDSELLHDDFVRNFHIQPSRVLHRLVPNQILPASCKDFEFCNKRIALIDSSEYFIPLQPKPYIDVLILSKNPKLYISNLLKTFNVGQIVIDGSVPQWKAKLWKKDCDSLHIPCFDVNEKGAFVMNL
ncbi:MAG: ComEC/Rec2 family competence protein [Flavisolibacter sp.]|nr:ComEC/Rec2 family competence protein [Flavisolibacter sp.]